MCCNIYVHHVLSHCCEVVERRVGCGERIEAVIALLICSVDLPAIKAVTYSCMANELVHVTKTGLGTVDPSFLGSDLCDIAHKACLVEVTQGWYQGQTTTQRL